MNESAQWADSVKRGGRGKKKKQINFDIDLAGVQCEVIVDKCRLSSVRCNVEMAA